MKLRKIYLSLLGLFLIGALLHGTLQAKAPEGKGWEKPEVPKTEAEKAALEKKIEQSKTEVKRAQEDVDVPKKDATVEDKNNAKQVLYLVSQELVADQAALDASNATKEADKATANKKLQDAAKIVEQALAGDFTSAGDSGGGGTELDQFTQDYSTKLDEALAKAVGQGFTNDYTKAKKEYDSIVAELSALEAGAASQIFPEVDYSTIGYAREKNILELLDTKLKSLLSIENLNSPIFVAEGNKVRASIEARIKEIDNFKRQKLLSDNTLNTNLGLGDKIRDDKLKALRTEFSASKLRAKSVSDRAKAFKELKEVLRTYDLPFSEMYTLNPDMATGFIPFLVQDASNDAERKLVLNDVMTSLDKFAYSVQITKLPYIDTVLQNSSFKQYADLTYYIVNLRDEVTRRKNEITNFLKARKDNKLPQPAPAESLAGENQLSEKIPFEQIKVVEKVFADFNQKIAAAEEKGDISTWKTLKEITDMQEILAPMRDLLDQIGKWNQESLYGVDDFALYKERLAEIGTQIKNIDDRLKRRQAELEVPGVPNVFVDAANSVVETFKEGAEVAVEAIAEKVAKLLHQSLDTIQAAVDAAIVKEGQLMIDVAARGESVAQALERKADLLNNIQDIMANLPPPIKGYLKGLQGYLEVGAWAAGQKSIVQDIANAVPLGKLILEGIQKRIEDIVGAIRAYTDPLKEAGKRVQQEALHTPADVLAIQERKKKYDEMKDWINKERTTVYPPEPARQKTYTDLFTNFVKQLFSWIKVQFVGDSKTPSLNDRYDAAQKNYAQVRKDYLNYLELQESASEQAIKNAIEAKNNNKVDTVENRKRLSEFAKAVSDLMDATRQMSQTLEAAQGSFVFLNDLANKLEVAGVKDETALGMIDAIIKAYQGRQDILKAALNSVTELRTTIDKEKLVSGGFILRTNFGNKAMTWFTDGLAATLTNQSIKTNADMQDKFDAMTQQIDEQKQKLQAELDKKQVTTPVDNSGGGGDYSG